MSPLSHKEPVFYWFSAWSLAENLDVRFNIRESVQAYFDSSAVSKRAVKGRSKGEGHQLRRWQCLVHDKVRTKARRMQLLLSKCWWVTDSLLMAVFVDDDGFVIFCVRATKASGKCFLFFFTSGIRPVFYLFLSSNAVSTILFKRGLTLTTNDTAWRARCKDDSPQNNKKKKRTAEVMVTTAQCAQKPNKKGGGGMRNAFIGSQPSDGGSLVVMRWHKTLIRGRYTPLI